MPEVSEAYYKMGLSQAFGLLKSSEQGLSKEEAERRLVEFGRNKLIEKKKFSLIKLIISQFTEFLVVILIFAAIVSWFVGEALDAYAIVAIIILNAILGVWQEFKAEKAMEALRKMAALNATVIREGHVQQVDSELLVPGDIVVLEAGSKVPADLRLIEAVNLKIDEAVLTGESNPVTKNSEAMATDAAIAERKNSCFANTIVTYGRGKGIVTSTGMSTEFGKIAGTLEEIEDEPTPLKQKLEVLGKHLGILFIVIVVALFFIGIFMQRPIFEMFEISVALAVAAIPEGLPAIITITLAIGTLQMARNNAIVRRMPAVEALGSATVICSDKTGTLTRNEMFVEKIYTNGKLFEVTGEGYEPEGEFLLNSQKIEIAKEVELKKLLEIAVHCNDAGLDTGEGNKGWGIIGDPTEAALVTMAWKGNNKVVLQRIDEIPFDSDRKMMTTVHRANEKIFAFAKGSPGKILSICSHVFEDGQILPLTQEKKEEISGHADGLAEQAYRVLGFAYKNVGKDYGKENLETELIFVGLAAMRDPPREGIEEAVKMCSTAGIKIKIITGDNALTAKAIGQKIGLPNVETISGDELDKLGQKEFVEAVKKYGIFSRVSPTHKYKIVSVLKDLGEIVAVTGDGVNDAPALKKADIGVAMGIKGTDVAKEASDLVLRDDYFGTIVVAVKEGRRIYSNIKSFVKYLLAANFGEIAVISVATIANLPSPLIPLQLLWINLVTDSLPALALGNEPAEEGVMNRPPRNPKEHVLHNMWSFVAIAALVSFVATMGGFLWGLGFDTVNGVNELDLSQASEARTMAFATLVVFELIFVFSCRIEDKSIFELHPLRNKALLGAVGFSFLLQVAAIYVPFFQAIFKTVPLRIEDWAVVFLLGSTSILVPYIDRAFEKLRGNK